MSNLIERLKAAKEKLGAAEKNKIVLETQIKGLEKELSDLGYSTVPKAKAAIEEMEKEISNLEDTLGELLHDFESKYAKLLED